MVRQNTRTRERIRGHVPLSLWVLRVSRTRVYFAYPFLETASGLLYDKRNVYFYYMIKSHYFCFAGAGTYEVSPDGVDVDLNLKIPSKAPNEEGGGEAVPPGSPGAPGGPEAPGGPQAPGSPHAPGSPGEGPASTKAPSPALCPVPCSQTQPTQSPSGGAPESVSPAGSAVPTSAGGGTSSPSTSQPTAPSAGGGAEGQDTFINRTKLFLKYPQAKQHCVDTLNNHSSCQLINQVKLVLLFTTNPALLQIPHQASWPLCKVA